MWVSKINYIRMKTIELKNSWKFDNFQATRNKFCNENI